MAEPSHSRSPKRKRADPVHDQPRSIFPDAQHLHKTIFSFETPSSSPGNAEGEDGGSSPRSKVAHRLQHLALDDHGGDTTIASRSGVIPAPQLQYCELGRAGSLSIPVAKEIDKSHETPAASSSSPQHIQQTGKPSDHATTSAVFIFDSAQSITHDDDMTVDDDFNTARKRLKLPDSTSGAVQNMGPKGEDSATAVEIVKQDKSGHIVLEATIDPQVIRHPRSSGLGSLKKSYPSINRLSDSKSRGRKKLPPSFLSKSTETNAAEGEPSNVVDPIRAALTWREDEITIYDPEDKDDDGTGINGIGFKPSAAVAYQRAQKRRQQLAEYNKREESEARARRNQRRREQLGAPPAIERKHSVVRVHFSEAEPSSVIMT